VIFVTTSDGMFVERGVMFIEIWATVEEWPGWLRRSQAERLWEAATRVRPGGKVVEIGSFRGKSTAVLAHGARPDVLVYAVDPHAGNDRGPGEWYGSSESGEQDHAAFVANLAQAELRDRVQYVREYSQLAHESVSGNVDFLYVDGAHGYRAATADLSGWGTRVCDGGEMYVHDVFNSFWVTLAILRQVAWGRQWRYLGRESSLAMYRREQVSWVTAALSTLRHITTMPVLGRSLVVKMLRRFGKEHWAEVLGHRPGAGCY
jgi:hypothetical protein